ncbi:MAG TPA: hypothetical protein VHN36_08725 [Ilumatobacteraceae bacterium]|nr:hypothetical protein [Ilumatobacteraceae bacterium]
MNAILAVTWEPQLRGILITIIAITVFCGSTYFILSTNLGARLGFLVAFAALAGWLFIMGAIWWSYGKGLLGPDASWAPISGRTVLTTGTINESGALDAPVVIDPNADATAAASAVDAQFVKDGWKKLESSVPSYQQAGAAAGTLLEESGALAAGEFQVLNVFDKGGQRSPQPFGSRFDFLAFFHKPHYAVVEVAPLVKQRDEPGRAPAKPEIDTSRPHQYVYMIRDLGAKRKPAGFITVGSLAVFLMLCYLLHTRDRRVLANRSARAIPAQTSSQPAPPQTAQAQAT